MSVSDTIPIQLHDCEAYLEGTIIHIRPKTMDRLLSEVAPSQDSPSSNEPSNHSEPELREDCDSPGQRIRDAEQSQQERMMQFGQSQSSSLADFTNNVIDSALADSVTTVPIYTTQTSPLILKQKYEKYQKIEPKSGKKSSKKKNLKSKPGSI